MPASLSSSPVCPPPGSRSSWPGCSRSLHASGPDGQPLPGSPEAVRSLPGHRWLHGQQPHRLSQGPAWPRPARLLVIPRSAHVGSNPRSWLTAMPEARWRTSTPGTYLHHPPGSLKSQCQRCQDTRQALEYTHSGIADMARTVERMPPVLNQMTRKTTQKEPCPEKPAYRTLTENLDTQGDNVRYGEGGILKPFR